MWILNTIWLNIDIDQVGRKTSSGGILHAGHGLLLFKISIAQLLQQSGCPEWGRPLCMNVMFASFLWHNIHILCDGGCREGRKVSDGIPVTRGRLSRLW